ncbi:MAG: hypothetical protein ACE37F_13810 [Nannocystaceae bacterium]|nr:hypothetical protein [bacterium]
MAGALLHRCELSPHPSCRDAVVQAVTVEIRRDAQGARLEATFVDDDARLALPEIALDPLRLWEHTCVELFGIGVQGPRYVEWNVSPTGQVARFEFADYRKRTRVTFPSSLSVSVERRAATAVVIAEGVFGLRNMTAGAVTAVVRSGQGSVAYWALSHPRPEPDFHDPAGFVLPL